MNHRDLLRPTLVGALTLLAAAAPRAIDDFVDAALAPQRLEPGTLGFVENRGQVDGRVLYYLPATHAAVYFTADAVVVDLRR
jgi:hypothetical protein